MDPFDFLEDAFNRVLREVKVEDAVTELQKEVHRSVDYIARDVEFIARQLLGDPLYEERETLERIFKQ